MSDDNWRTELRNAFTKFDSDGNDAIDKAEFNALLDALGSEMSANDREIGFVLVDKDENGAISYDELASWWDIVRAEASS